MTKKFKAIKKKYRTIEDTHWEEFEMTQETWTALYDYAEQSDAEFVKDLPKQMTTNIDDWKELYSALAAGEFPNVEEESDVNYLEAEETIDIVEVKD